MALFVQFLFACAFAFCLGVWIAWLLERRRARRFHLLLWGSARSAPQRACEHVYAWSPEAKDYVCSRCDQLLPESYFVPTVGAKKTATKGVLDSLGRSVSR